MKKYILTLFALLVSASTFAQFERDKFYVNTSLTGLGLSYSNDTKLNLGVSATAGCFLEDCWAVVGEGEINYKNKKLNDFDLGVGARYYILQNGIYLGLTGRFHHQQDYYEVIYEDAGVRMKDLNDFQLKAEVGYAFFINHYMTIEPAVYYRQSFKSSDLNEIGAKIGVGFYF